MELLTLIIIGLVIALFAGSAAEKKGRSFGAWTLIAFFFPVISWIIIAAMAPVQTGGSTQSASTPAPPQLTKVCPYCAESIQHAAVVCRYCGRDI